MSDVDDAPAARSSSRRGLLLGAAAAVPAIALARPLAAMGEMSGMDHMDSPTAGPMVHAGHAGLQGGSVPPKRAGIDPTAILRDFDKGTVSKLPDGRTLREWQITAVDREFEIAPGVTFPAWTYNGRIPGPTLWAQEGDALRIHFTNAGSHPHTMHFHGIHTAEMDGTPGVGAGNIPAGASFTYEFDATPFGTHLYHCHTSPLAHHIARGSMAGSSSSRRRAACPPTTRWSW
ncbi:MAG: copper oxidase [Nocardioidaceae bacterium]|nr:copper oxidase [Nocardioidaceae bacterium]